MPLNKENQTKPGKVLGAAVSKEGHTDNLLG